MKKVRPMNSEEKIDIMFQNKNAANQVSVFRKLVRLQYQDGSSMAEHMNAFQGLIHQATRWKYLSPMRY